MIEKRNIPRCISLSLLLCLLVTIGTGTEPDTLAAMFHSTSRNNPLPEFDDSYGVVFRDVNGDAAPDLYVTRFRNLNRFFVQDQDGSTFRDETIASGLGGNLEPRGLQNLELGAFSADFNNDGLAEILIIGWGNTTRLFKQHADHTFRDVTVGAGLQGPMSGNGAAVADVDKDGDLDLFITDEHGTNHLFLQTGELQFQDVSRAWGFSTTTISQDATFSDVNGDSYPDLYVCNWRQPDDLYLNDRGRGFLRMDLTLDHLQESYNSNDAVFFDYNNDGDQDLLVTDRHGRTQLYAREGRGDTLDFRPVSQVAGLENFYPCYSALIGDLDNNGWLDVFFANIGPNLLYLNEGGNFSLTFLEDLPRPVYSTGGALADADGDGDLDLFVANKDTTSRLYLNPGPGKHWLRVRVEGVRSNRDGLGSVVHLYEGKKTPSDRPLATREVGSTSGYLSQSEAVVHFGLPQPGPYWVEVTFPSGERRRSGPLAAGQTVVIAEYDGIIRHGIRFYQGLSRFLTSPSFWLHLGLYAVLIALVLAYTGLLLKRYGWRWRRIALFLFLLFVVYYMSDELVRTFSRPGLILTQIAFLVILGAALFGFLERIRQLKLRRYGYRQTLLSFSDQLILWHDNDTLAQAVTDTLADALQARHASFWVLKEDQLHCLKAVGRSLKSSRIVPLPAETRRRLEKESLLSEGLAALFGTWDDPAYLLTVKNEDGLLALILLVVPQPLEAEDASVLGMMTNQIALTLVNNAFIEETRLLTRQVAEAEMRQETIRALEKKNKELEALYRDLKATQKQLIHSEKMSSLGQLVAGIAHELNNPIGYIYANMQELNQALATLNKQDGTVPPDLDQMIADSLEGSRRIKHIVASLRKFSRLDEEEKAWMDIQEGLEATLSLMKNEFKGITITRHYKPLPPVFCQPGQINQVFMNIILNAVQALDGRGTITITTALEASTAVVQIHDDGPGIPPEVQVKIFDPFFTTKPVGTGTGLGLSISYGIITNHGGSLTVRSQAGEGTTFSITLPVEEKNEDEHSHRG
ncbi:MAG: FG-GAP-like repeat-containing protein [Fidelibacterota bacterium]